MSDDDEITRLEALREAAKSPPPGQTLPPPPGADESDWKGRLDAPTPVTAFRPSSMPPPSSDRDRDPLDRPTPVSAFMPSSIPPPPTTQPAPPRRQTLRPGLAPGLFGLGASEPPRAAPPEPPQMDVIEVEVDSISSSPPPPSGRQIQVDAPDRPSGALPHEETFESRSRLVSAPPVALGTSEKQAPSEPTLEVHAADISASELAALEADHAPTSSRRPISMEAKMNEPEDAVPLHAPPPASGKLPTAAPAIELASVQPELPPLVEVAVFVTEARGEPGQMTFGELLDEALSL